MVDIKETFAMMSCALACGCIEQQPGSSVQPVAGTHNIPLASLDQPLAECPIWTPWLNRDLPSGAGDFETRVDFGSQVPCSNPLAIQCQTIAGVDWTLAGEVYSCTPSVGGFCRNNEQPDGTCMDYQVRFLCP
jgi:Mucin-2 protein WxxW repeating region